MSTMQTYLENKMRLGHDLIHYITEKREDVQKFIKEKVAEKNGYECSPEMVMSRGRPAFVVHCRLKEEWGGK